MRGEAPHEEPPPRRLTQPGAQLRAGPGHKGSCNSDLAASRSLSGCERQPWSGVAATGMQCSPGGTRGGVRDGPGRGRGRAGPCPGLARLSGRPLVGRPCLMAEGSRHWGLGTQRGAGLVRGGAGRDVGAAQTVTCHYHLPWKHSAPAIQKVLCEFGKHLSATCLSTHVFRPALGGQAGTSKKPPPVLEAQRNPPLAESSAQMKRIVASCL